MTIHYEQNFSTKPTAVSTAETISFGTDFIIGTGVRAYHLGLTGTAMDVDALDRLRVKAGGQTIVDVTEQHLRALIQSMSPSNFDVANGDTRISIPLYFLDRPKNDPSKWDCGFPNGLAPTVEIVHDGTASGAGTMALAYTYDDDPQKLPRFYPMFIGNDTNAGASASRAWSSITQKGWIAGFSILTTNLTTFELVLNGRSVLNLNTAQLLEAQQLGNSDVVTTTIFFRLDEPLPVGPGSGFYITGAAGWVTTNQVGILTYVPQGS